MSVSAPAKSLNKTCVFVFLAMVCFGLYSNCLHNQFLYDEQGLIQDNPYIKDLRFFPRILDGSPSSAGRIYRPVLMLYYSLCYLFFGLSPFGYHFVSIALYCLGAFLVFLFINKLFRDETLALFCAILFAAHPVHAKEAAIAADVPFVLEGVFVLSCLILFLRYTEKKRFADYLFSLIFFILAIFSRESALLVPLFMVLSALAYGADRKTALPAVGPFFLLGAAYFLLRQVFVPVEQLAIDPTGLMRRVPAFFYYCHQYIRQLILMPYAFAAGEPAQKVIGAFATGGAVLFYAVLLRLFWRRNKVVIFGCAFFLLALLPLLNLSEKIDAYGLVVFDHYVYLASLGVILVFAFFLRRFCVSLPRTAVLALALVVICYGTLITRSISHYRNEESYYRYLLSLDGGCAFCHAGLANVYFQKGMLWHAQKEAEQALHWKEAKKISRVYTTLGSIYCRRRNLDTGIDYYRLAIKADPEYNIAYIDLALAYVLQGKFKDAELNFRRGLQLDPADLFALKNFGEFLYLRGQYLEAIDICARILELYPDDLSARDILARISRDISFKGKTSDAR